MEMEGDTMISLFLNEIYGFQLDNHRWYPLELRKEKATKDKSKKDLDMRPNNTDFESKISIVEKENFSSDEDENSDNDDTAMEIDVDNISDNTKRNGTIVAGEGASGSGKKDLQSSKKVAVQNSVSPEIVKPCGRINSCMVVGKDTLYIYGGMMEIRDQEITLDDLYMLNLSKLDEWKCIIQASESEWVEASDDEDVEDDSEMEESESEDDDVEESDDEEDIIEGTNDATVSLEMGNAVAIIKGEGKNIRRKDKRARIEQIRASLGLSDSQRTPMPGESLKDFYKRTNMYWQMAAYEHTQHTGKELRRDGFDLAESRYKELKPILDELAVLEAEQKAEEEEGPETSVSRKKSNNNKLSSSK